MDGRVMPHDRAAEEAVVGGILIRPDALKAVGGELDVHDFYVEAHQVIYRAMQKIVAADKPIDMITLGHALRESGDLERIGGNSYLAALIDATPTTANIENHARIVHEQSEVRKAIWAAREVVATGMSGDQEEAIRRYLAVADSLRQERLRKGKVRTIADLMPEVEQMYERTKRGEMGVPFPWPTMTEMTLGLWPGTLTFFVARPGVGKSWTAVIIAWHAWMQGYKVLIVSPEMSGVELGERVVSKHGSLSYGDVVGATLGMYEEQRLMETFQTLKTTDAAENFRIIDDEDRLEPAYIEDAIDDLKPDVVLVDSVYMMKVQEGRVKSGAGSKGDRMERMVSTVSWLRRMARRTQIPIVGVSQLAREGGKIKKKTKEKVKRGESTGGLESTLAMTDTILWDVHNLFALYQDDDMKLHNQMMYVPLKVRRRAKIAGVVASWDMTTMEFNEIGTKVETEEHVDEQFDDEIPF